MAQSKKYTIQIERVLKEYPYICWRINNQQSSLNKELKQMGIRKESIEFLKNISKAFLIPPTVPFKL